MKHGVLVLVLMVCLLWMPGALRAQDSSDGGCQEMVTLLKVREDKLSADLRRIQREIAALRADLDEPGMENIFSGIGYILGIFGTAAFVAARRRKE
ncbi:MAG: hypothetical protein WBY88_13015 [Desulfosarcina sp.]